MNGWQEAFEMLSSPLAPEWFVGIVGTLTLIYAIRVFDQTRRQADAATQQVEIAKKQLHSDQRAWVTVNKANITHNIVAGSQVGFVIEITNTGKTPALDVSTAVNIHMRPQITQEILDGIVITNQPHSRAVIGPGGSVTINQEVGICTPKQFEEFQSGFVLFVYGSVFYEDIFKQKHITTFCLCTDRSRHKSSWILSASEFGNTAD